MNENIKEILSIWHAAFEDDTNQYSEFEPSDIEYFVGCMLYNKLNFINALDTMKTIDLSYDFLVSVEDSYESIKNKIDDINIEDEDKKLEFLIEYLNDAKSKYSADELYLINRLVYHVDGIKQRFDGELESAKVDFVAPPPKSRNPLLR